MPKPYPSILLLYTGKESLTIDSDTDTNSKFGGNIKESQTPWNSQK